MKTTYLTSILCSFNPFSRSGAVPRLFLQLLPPKAHKDIQIKQSVLPRSSTQPALLELGFKDGKKMTWSWSDGPTLKEGAEAKGERRVALEEIVNEVNRHARILGRKEELSG